MLDALRGVRWSARRPVAPSAPGSHRSRRHGIALEFTEYRPYRQGDDPRRLDWKLLARTDRAYVRLTDDHTVLPTAIVIDASASMAYPAATLGKWRLASALAVGFAAVAQASGDPVGLTIVSGEHVVGEVARTTRRGIVATIARLLHRTTPGPAASKGSRLVPAGRVRHVIISDFLQDAVPVLPEHAEVYAVHVVAREEIDPPRGAWLVSDPEDDSVRRPLLNETRAAYLDAFGAWREAIRQQWRTAGASFALVETDESPERAVRRVVRE
ncbi:MAG TPA: DUF58 domain-containing protein [Gemmatimonadaceae bacterium]|nr:DUF58 domain-containing protein [Gemmatimonadaceae bacterium]